MREIEEVRRKYNGFIHDAEMTFQQNLELIQTKISKVLKNLMLAEAFRLMVTDPTKSIAPALRQGTRHPVIFQEPFFLFFRKQNKINGLVTGLLHRILCIRDMMHGLVLRLIILYLGLLSRTSYGSWELSTACSCIFDLVSAGQR